MRALKLLQSLGLLLAFGISGSVVAEPRVVVSLAPYGAGSALQMTGVDQYFRHRYLAFAAFETDNRGSLRKVSTSIAATCTHTNDNAETLTPGSDYYFAAMRQTAQAVAGCMQRLEAAKTVSNQNGPVRKES
jgi:hypothetical protein